MPVTTNANYQPTSRTKIQMSRHAVKRERQRAIPTGCIPLIKIYGEMSHDGRGGIRYVMTNRALTTLMRTIGRTKRLEALAACYVVVAADDPDFVITVGHLYS